MTRRSLAKNVWRSRTLSRSRNDHDELDSRVGRPQHELTAAAECTSAPRAIAEGSLKLGYPVVASDGPLEFLKGVELGSSDTTPADVRQVDNSREMMTVSYCGNWRSNSCVRAACRAAGTSVLTVHRPIFGPETLRYSDRVPVYGSTTPQLPTSHSARGQFRSQ